MQEVGSNTSPSHAFNETDFYEKSCIYSWQKDVGFGVVERCSVITESLYEIFKDVVYEVLKLKALFQLGWGGLI